MTSAKKPLFAFFGTPLFSVRVLDALEAHGYLPALVITAPDKPRGRGLEVSPSPAKEWAEKRGIDTLEPATLKDASVLDELANTDWDVFIVAAYAKLLPKSILDLPRRGCLNVHPSLLPALRGPSPARSAILEDRRESGVTVMQMAEQMDAGPIVAQARIEIDATEWPPAGSMYEDLLSTEGGNLLAEVLPDWLEGNITAAPQDEAQATFCKKFTDDDALIDLRGDAHQALLKIRAFDASPRAHFFATAKDGRRLRVNITDAAVEDGALKILRVVPEGKKEMPYEDFLRSGAQVS